MNAATQLLRELVARPSINPAFEDDPAVSGEEIIALSKILLDRIDANQLSQRPVKVPIGFRFDNRLENRGVHFLENVAVGI